MVLTKEKLIGDLISDGYLKSPAIIDAFNTIDRADFVPEASKNMAYLNQPLPIGCDQTISQPLTVAFMLELLEPKAGERILDVGSGSGWQSALLAKVIGDSGKVIGIERILELKEMTDNNLSKYEFKNIRLVLGDGSKGFPEEAPYDKIIAAASGTEIPLAWKEQVRVGGKIVAPVGESIILLEKKSPDQFVQKQFFGFSFVPLIGENEE